MDVEGWTRKGKGHQGDMDGGSGDVDVGYSGDMFQY